MQREEHKVLVPSEETSYYIHPEFKRDFADWYRRMKDSGYNYNNTQGFFFRNLHTMITEYQKQLQKDTTIPSNIRVNINRFLENLLKCSTHDLRFIGREMGMN